MVSFRSAQGEQQVGFSFQDIDLSVPRTKEKLGIAGNFIFIPTQAFDGPESVSETKTTGIAFARPTRLNADPLLLAGGQLYQLEPFDEMFITNDAQPDAMLRIYFSVNQIIEPAAGTIGEVQRNIALENLLKDSVDQRAALTTLENAETSNVQNGATATIVKETENTNGVVIRWASLRSTEAGKAAIETNGAVLVECNSSSGQTNTKHVRDLFIPPGQSLYIESDAEGPTRVTTFYEVL